MMFFGVNRSDFIQLILSGQNKKKSSVASRSLPGHASIILLCFSFIVSVALGTYDHSQPRLTGSSRGSITTPKVKVNEPANQ